MDSPDDTSPQSTGKTINAAVTDALTALATVGFTTFEEIRIVLGQRAIAEKTDEIAHALASALATPMIGMVAATIDAHPIEIGDIKVTTRLVDFAHGSGCVSPIDEISIEHPFSISLLPIATPVGSANIGCGIQVRSTTTFDKNTGKPTTAVGAELSVNVDWSSKKSGET